MRRPPRALVLWCATALVALVTAGVVGSDLAAIHRRATGLGAERTVVVAARDLSLGRAIAPGDLVEARRHASQVPIDALGSADHLIGRVVTVPALESTVVVERQIAPASRTGLDGVLPRGRRAVRVPDSDGLRPEPGARVDVIATFDPALVGDDKEPTGVVAPGALVLDLNAADDTADAGVLVMVATDDAAKLAFALANGTVTLALAPPEP